MIGVGRLLLISIYLVIVHTMRNFYANKLMQAFDSKLLLLHTTFLIQVVQKVNFKVFMWAVGNHYGNVGGKVHNS